MPRLFVHCATSVAYASGLGIPGVERYAERALVLADRGDVVCVPAPVDTDYLAFLLELGLGPWVDDVVVVPRGDKHPEDAPLWRRLLDAPGTLDRVVGLLRHHAARSPNGGPRLHPFIVSAGHFELAATLEAALGAPVPVAGGDPGIVQDADRKDYVRKKARELGIPVADGEVVELPFPGGQRRPDLEPLRAAVARHIGRTGRVIVRGASGAAGSSTFVIGRDAADLDTALSEIAARADNRTYLVESMVDVLVSPNVQLHIAEDGAVTCIGVTDQLLGGALAHLGNLFPSEAQTAEEMLHWAGVMARWLRDEGYAGPVGFDFVEYADARTGRPRALLAEINPRVNSATYPLGMMMRLNAAQRRAGRPPSSAFVAGTVETNARSFAELRAAAGHLFYSPVRGSGAVPYAVGCLEHGRCGVVVLADSRAGAWRDYDTLRTALRRVRR